MRIYKFTLPQSTCNSVLPVATLCKFYPASSSSQALKEGSSSL